MSKKDLASVTTDLAALAGQLPTQRPPSVVSLPPPAAPKAAPAAKPKAQSEPVTQFSLSLRKGLRDQLAHLARDADMTMRAFVLNALKAKGLKVEDDDLLDLRKGGR